MRPISSVRDRRLVGEAGSERGRDELVPWWSFTKTILAAAALRLVGLGKLRLDQPLDGVRYTLRHLLQHTSGLPDYGPLPAYHAAVAGGAEPWSRDELLSRADVDRLIFPPGAGWAYSNIGYLFVREMIEQAAAATLNDALRSIAFEPLGIEDAFVAASPADWERTLWSSRQPYDPRWVYHGLVVGPPSASADFLHRLLLTGFLEPALKKEMLTPLSLGGPLAGRPAVDPGYGLGLMIDAASPLRRIAGHTGQGPGSTCAIYCFMDLPEPRTLAVFAPDDGVSMQGQLERELQTLIT